MAEPLGRPPCRAFPEPERGSSTWLVARSLDGEQCECRPISLVSLSSLTLFSHDSPRITYTLTLHPFIFVFRRNSHWLYVSVRTVLHLPPLTLMLFPLAKSTQGFSHSPTQTWHSESCPRALNLQTGYFPFGLKASDCEPPIPPKHPPSAVPLGSTNTLVAVGGQDAELHLSLHSSSSSSSSSSSYCHRSSRPHWQYKTQLQGSLNDSVMLTSLSLTKANVSSAELRVVVNNNDCSVKFFEVNIRVLQHLWGKDSSPTDISQTSSSRTSRISGQMNTVDLLRTVPGSLSKSSKPSPTPLAKTESDSVSPPGTPGKE